jgi:predicted Zn-dependent protease
MKKRMLQRVHVCARFILFGCALVLSTTIAAAQTIPRPPASDGPPRERDQSPMGGFEDELRAKRAIKMAEKDHEENLERAREIGELAKQLQTSLKDKSTIDRESAKKLDRLEKLTKKIRNESGGEDEEVKIVDQPTDITGAVNQIAESAESLSKAVQNTPRQVVSASVIGEANVLLELIKLLRAFDPRP